MHPAAVYSHFRLLKVEDSNSSIDSVAHFLPPVLAIAARRWEPSTRATYQAKVIILL